MLPLLPLCALLLGATAEEHLSRAQRAYDAGRFSEVQPLAEAALEHAQLPSERARAWVLLGKAQAAFNASDEAVSLFARALGEDPALTLDARESPKVRALFEQARARARTRSDSEAGAVAPGALPSARVGQQGTDGTHDAATSAETPLHRRWWVWAGVGVIAAGAATVWATTPNFPQGNLGKRELR